MNEFKREFSELLLRYGVSNSNENIERTDIPTILTNDQIVNAIKEVLSVTLKINLDIMEAHELKTPANEIVITTPNAPDVLRVDYNQNNTLLTKCKVLEALNKENDDNYLKSCNLSLLSNHSGEMTELFDNKCSITEIDTIKVKKAKIPIITPATKNIVEEAYKNAVKVKKKLEDLRELLSTETKPSLRLSSIIRLSNPRQFRQQQQASIQYPKGLRRFTQPPGTIAPPATPTSSRPNLAPPCRVPKKRPAEKRPFGQQNHTVAEPGKSQPRGTKFAHVKSTIPKPTASIAKRKPQ